MKVLLCVLFLASYCGKTAKAQEGNNPEVKPESDITATTKKTLRKIGRKTMDATCEMTEGKAECERQRIEHQKAEARDVADTEKRKATKEARLEAERAEKARRNAQLDIKEQACREENGKLVCAGKKTKEKLKNVVE